MHTIRFVSPALIALLLLFCIPVQAEDAATATHDGLREVKSDKVESLYVKPEASLQPYTRIALLDCYVAFRKDWRRDQNSTGHRVSKSDMDRIREHLAEEFRTVFTDVLQSDGGYELTDEGGEDVLILRPAIIDLDVTAPDTLSAGMSRTFTTSAGAMTLYLELHDGATGEIIARIADRRSARDQGGLQFQNSIRNKQEADRMLKKWAGLLREALDHAHEQMKQPPQENS